MKESQIQRTIEEYLKLLENMGKLVYIKNNSGAFPTKEGHFVRFGKAGSPDFVVFMPNGKSIHLEVKNETGKQNPNQVAYQKMIEKLGHQYIIARNLDDVEILIKWWYNLGR